MTKHTTSDKIMHKSQRKLDWQLNFIHGFYLHLASCFWTCRKLVTLRSRCGLSELALFGVIRRKCVKWELKIFPKQSQTKEYSLWEKKKKTTYIWQMLVTFSVTSLNVASEGSQKLWSQAKQRIIRKVWLNHQNVWRPRTIFQWTCLASKWIPYEKVSFHY